MAQETAILLIKPDAIERGLVEIIEQELKGVGLAITERFDVQLNEEMIRRYQPVLNEPSEFGEGWKYEAIEFLTSRPVIVYILIGDGAIQKTTKIKRKIRSQHSPGEDYQSRVIRNLIHSADDERELCLNLKVLAPHSRIR